MMQARPTAIRRFAGTGSLVMLWALPAILVFAYVLPFAGVTLWSATGPNSASKTMSASSPVRTSKRYS